MTFYTVSKLNVLCGPTDQKIALSRGWSYLNLLLSTIGFAGGTYWLLVLEHRIEELILFFVIIISELKTILDTFFNSLHSKPPIIDLQDVKDKYTITQLLVVLLNVHVVHMEVRLADCEVANRELISEVS